MCNIFRFFFLNYSFIFANHCIFFQCILIFTHYLKDVLLFYLDFILIIFVILDIIIFCLFQNLIIFHASSNSTDSILNVRDPLVDVYYNLHNNTIFIRVL